MKSEIINYGLFALAWGLVSLAFWDEFLLASILFLIGVVIILNRKDPETGKYFLFGCLAYFLEYIPTFTGAWSYCDSLLGVPLWVSPLAGITFITVVYIVSDEK